jgi:hypothetical protein
MKIRFTIEEASIRTAKERRCHWQLKKHPVEQQKSEDVIGN